MTLLTTHKGLERRGGSDPNNTIPMVGPQPNDFREEFIAEIERDSYLVQQIVNIYNDVRELRNKAGKTDSELKTDSDLFQKTVVERSYEITKDFPDPLLGSVIAHLLTENPRWLVRLANGKPCLVCGVARSRVAAITKTEDIETSFDLMQDEWIRTYYVPNSSRKVKKREIPEFDDEWIRQGWTEDSPLKAIWAKTRRKN